MLPKGNVSKRHARLLYRDGRFIVTDLNSTNGTYVNRRRITQATIVREGDRIYVGDFVLRIELPAGEGDVAVSDGASRPELVSSPDEVSATGPTPAAANLAANLRASSDDEDEQTRNPAPARTLEPPRPPSSSLGSDPPPLRPASFPGNETTGTHHVGRTTQDDSPSYERNALASVLHLVVQAVVERLGAEAFEPPLAVDLRERVEPVLREIAGKVAGV